MKKKYTVRRKKAAPKRAVARKRVHTKHAKKAAVKKHSKRTHKRKISAAKGGQRGTNLVRYVEKSSTERVLNGKKRKRKSSVHRRKPHRSRSRSMGKSGSNINLLLLGVLGIGAVYLLTKKSSQTTSTNTTQLQPRTSVATNTQANQILAYATAAGLAVGAIADLIRSLNTSSDAEVQQIYDKVVIEGDYSNIA